MNNLHDTSSRKAMDPRALFDAASIPGMREKLADAYAAFRAAEWNINVERSPPLNGGSIGIYHERNCPACRSGHDHATLVAQGHGIRVLACNCGFFYAAAVLEEGAEEGRYLESEIDAITMRLRDTPEYFALESARSNYYLDLIERHQPSERSLLEIGCGSGTFLMRADARGWKTLGIEPGRAASAHAQYRGANVVKGFFPAVIQEHRQFGTIAMLDVFEHIVEPKPFLAEVRQHLRPGGLLFLQVPNWESLLIQIEGGDSTIVSPGHWSYFTSNTMRSLVESCGYAQLSTETVVSEVDRILAYGDRYKEAYRRLRPDLPIPDPIKPSDLYDAGLGYKLISVFKML